MALLPEPRAALSLPDRMVLVKRLCPRVPAQRRGADSFVNSDLIASGLSPLRPELAALAGGRLFLTELDRLARARVDFAFESTSSGLVYLNRLKRWKSSGYRIEISYLRLSSPQLGICRIAARVKQGGHHVPRADVLRRFNRRNLSSRLMC